MVYVVERYLPGLDQRRLLRMLGDLEQVTAELRAEGTDVRYIGSTIVPDDEACFCQFEGASQAACDALGAVWALQQAPQATRQGERQTRAPFYAAIEYE